jgi:hypothetical protein
MRDEIVLRAQWVFRGRKKAPAFWAGAGELRGDGGFYFAAVARERDWPRTR